MAKKKHLRVLSLGAGVQSTTLALMIVYEHLDWLEKQLSYPIYKVQWRNLREDIISASQGKYKAFTAPFFSKNIETDKKSMLRRQCTGDYKIKPLQQKVRELLGYNKGERVAKDTHVEMLMGISWDELQRQKTNQIKYITNIYPLIERQIRRHQCLKWMETNNYPKPPRSACTFCPYHSNEEWRLIKQNKEEWDEVIKLDQSIRNQEQYKYSQSGSVKDQLYLHRDCKPIDEVDLRTDEERGQYSLLDECEGMCGI